MVSVSILGGRGVSLSRFGLALFAITVLLFLSLPIVIIVPMSFSSASSLPFPPPGLSLRWYASFFGDPRWLRAAWTSVLVAFASSGAALLIGRSLFSVVAIAALTRAPGGILGSDAGPGVA
jgi:ABC-type spermidine/putrescine transport system permease subunit II